MQKFNFINPIVAGLIAAVLCALSLQAAVSAALPTTDGLPTLAPILKKTTPAVVNISTEATVKSRRSQSLPFQAHPFFGDPLFRRFFGQPPYGGTEERRRSGIGSGVIIDADKGHIITNHHVIDGADEIYVTLSDGHRYQAEVVGTDPGADIAVIIIDAENLAEILFGDSEQLQVGDFVVAIGNPFQLGQTVTLGIVSALGRSGLGIESYEDFIQTDASINPGNSGGALINLKGELVGINTAIFGSNRGNIGIGFAIPANMARNITAQLIEHGEVRRGRLGVVVQTLTPDLAQAFGLEPKKGVVIVEVEPDSAADRAGMEPGDVVLMVDGREIENSADIRNYIGLLRAGSEIELEVLRGERRMNVTAAIVALKTAAAAGGEIDRRLAGASLVLQQEKKSERDGILVGKLVQGSPAQRNGLRRGDLVVSVNRHPVRSFEEMKKLVDENRPLLLNLLRGGRAMFLALQ